MRVWIAAVVAMLAGGSRALADPADRSDLGDDALHGIVGVGIYLGTIDAGAMTSHGGIDGLFGVRVWRVAVLGEVDLAPTSANADDAHLGGFVRGAFEARLSLWEGRVLTKPGRYVQPYFARGDIWVEPAVGYELASQPGMPALERPDVSLAIGYEETHRTEATWSGGFVAVRVMAAAGDQVSVLVTTGVTIGS
jgi:hypothetical protein